MSDDKDDLEKFGLDKTEHQENAPSLRKISAAQDKADKLYSAVEYTEADVKAAFANARINLSKSSLALIKNAKTQQEKAGNYLSWDELWELANAR